MSPETTPKPKGGKRPGAGRKKGYQFPETRAKAVATERAFEKLVASKERTMMELASIAHSSLGDFMAPDGNWKPFHELTREQAACVKSVKVVKRNVEAGDGHVDTVYELVLWDKPKALEMLAKHFGLLLEKIEHSGGIELKWQD